MLSSILPGLQDQTEWTKHKVNTIEDNNWFAFLEIVHTDESDTILDTFLFRKVNCSFFRKIVWTVHDLFFHFFLFPSLLAIFLQPSSPNHHCHQPLSTVKSKPLHLITVQPRPPPFLPYCNHSFQVIASVNCFTLFIILKGLVIIFAMLFLVIFVIFVIILVMLTLLLVFIFAIFFDRINFVNNN